MSNYRKVRKETAERMGESNSDDPADEKLPCRFCEAPTRRGDLSMYGARCLRCYEAYRSIPMAEFNARFKRSEPKAALPRGDRVVTQGHIGELIAKRPTSDQVRDMAADMGIDIPAEYSAAELNDMRRAQQMQEFGQP